VSLLSALFGFNYVSLSSRGDVPIYRDRGVLNVGATLVVALNNKKYILFLSCPVKGRVGEGFQKTKKPSNK